MARTESTMKMNLGQNAPDFLLLDTVSQKNYSLNSFFPAKGLVIMFLCNHCPFVKHVQNEITRIYDVYFSKGIKFVGISSNDIVEFPADSPENMKLEAEAAGYEFPYLFDDTQMTAKSYFASCTPDFFVLDSNRKLFYRGQLDDSRPGNGLPTTGDDLRSVLEALLNEEQPPEKQRPSLGCGIKWKNNISPY